MTEERRSYRKNLLWACNASPDDVVNRVVELEVRINELEDRLAGPYCPKCGSSDMIEYPQRGSYQCKKCDYYGDDVTDLPLKSDRNE